MALPPVQQPAPGPDSISLNRFAGIKNTVSRERLKPDELVTGGNIDIDDAGQIHRRRGYRRVNSSPCSSLFTANSGVVFGVEGSTLGVINPDYSFIPLQTGVGTAPISYVQVGRTVYFSSVSSSGKINTASLTVEPWGIVGGAATWLSPVVNPTTTLAPIQGKLLRAPPLARFLTYFNGRIYMAVGNVLWATELYLYDFVNATRTYMTFETEIMGLGTVTDGIYVGTEDGTWFLSGPQFSEFKRQSLMNAGVVPGSMIPIPGELADPHNLDQPVVAKNSVMFLTPQGLCVGEDGGQVFNLTQTHVWFPDAISAAALWRRQDGVNQYLGVLDSGGMPTDGARIGDYISAEIIRFKGA